MRHPNAFSEPVADHAVALILAHIRNIFISDRSLKNGGWHKPGGRTMDEITIGNCNIFRKYF
jgi:phosphoglycerate dehydrogenase-like enzyme